MAEPASAQGIGDLLRSAADLVFSGAEPQEALRWALEVVCRYTGSPLGRICLVGPDADALVPDDAWYVADDAQGYEQFMAAASAAPLTDGHGPAATLLTGAEPLWVAEMEREAPSPRREAALAAGICAAFAIPVVSERGVEGMMEFYQVGPVQPDSRTLGLIAHVGTQLGHLLDRHRSDLELRASQSRLAEAERVGRAGSWSWQVGAEAVTWSDELRRIYGLEGRRGAVTFDGYIERIHPADRERVLELINGILTLHRPYEHEYRIVMDDGSVRWVRSRVAVVAEEGGAVRRLAGHCQDVTDRKQAEEAHQLSRAELESHSRLLERIARGEPAAEIVEAICREIEGLYDGACCSVLLVDPVTRVLHHFAAPSLPASFCAAIDGLAVAEGAGACGTAAARNQAVVVSDTLSHPLTSAFVGLARQHGLRSVWSQPMTSSQGEVIGTFALYRARPHAPDRDEVRTVSTSASLAALALERSRVEAALVTAANFDLLTGLANRSSFVVRLNQRLAAGCEGVAVMFIDLDGFKWINDSLGHPAGDRVLKEVAQRLAAAVGERHHLARFGGDEFTVLLTGASAEEIERVSQTVHATISEPFFLDGGEFFLTCSVGIAVNDDMRDADELVRDADSAMFAAKERGGGRQAWFDEGLRERALGRVTLETELRRSIERGEFEMYYQPIVELASSVCVGLEALVRWRHPTRGLVLPGAFVPLAEENGLIVPLGQQILEMVLRERATWPPGCATYVSVNLSAVQLADAALGATLRASLSAYGLAPGDVVVEVTETALMLQVEAAFQALEEMRQAGIRVLVDDFGTGYSSVSRLGQLPITGVKIDNSFARDLGREPRADDVVRAITVLGHALGLQVIVEGIESLEALAGARACGCDAVQGYHLGRPMPAHEARAFLELHGAGPGTDLFL